MAINQDIRNMQRRLRRWELEHLRQLVADLHERLERAEAEAEWASENAEFWQSFAMELQEAFDKGWGESPLHIGLTQDGRLMVLKYHV